MKILEKERKIEGYFINFIQKNIFNLVMIAVFMLTIVVRMGFINFKSLDFINCLKSWYDFISKHGFKNLVADYTPPYLYILAICTHLHVYSLYAIKLVSILFDYISAGAIFYLVNLKTQNKKLSLIASLVFLLAPTVLLNSAAWAQCDVIYTSFILLAIYCLCKNYFSRGIIFFSIALAFKLQAIFFLPVLIILYLQKRFSIFNFLIVPITIILAGIPMAILSGKTIGFIIEHSYFDQMKEYPALTSNAFSIYQLISPSIGKATIFFATLSALIVISVIALFLLSRIGNFCDAECIIRISLIIVLAVPFFLPKMHERYFYLADVISILYMFYVPLRRSFFVPIIIISASYCSYYTFLFGMQHLELKIASFMILGLLAYLIVDFYKYSIKIRKQHSEVLT